ncbi:hypothetical protein GCM10010259_02060 [Streptomyces daghestanicus]|uniref:Uncharacterized protein n=2 Tax=Streptomyces TaxID=1883 RepID=A0A918GLD9_STRGD|nr:hypothetical protein GCM10010238_35610 [Streptomyces niveoruber]GGU15404.1 hypothetical protein GCM10010259_02060 [Streptomyces daghestanicus]GHI35188.1 hypothetical protein Sdagh_69180 [Streptomyces daghestanicus]
MPITVTPVGGSAQTRAPAHVFGEVCRILRGGGKGEARGMLREV